MTTLTHPFQSISHLLAHYRLPQSRYCDGWRLTDCFQGEIEGLPTYRGQCIATDGIMCIIRREDDSIVFGHIAHFICDSMMEQPAISFLTKSNKSKTKTTTKTEICFAGF